MSEVFYRKVGRRYPPVSQHDTGLLNALPVGSHLVVVAPGSLSVVFQVHPDSAPVLAALRACRDDLLQWMREASEPRPAKVLLTQQEREAWEAFRRSAGYDLLLVRPAAGKILDRLEKSLMVEVAKMNLVRDTEECGADFAAWVDQVARYQKTLADLLLVAKNKNLPVGTRLMRMIAELEETLNAIQDE